MQGQVGTESKRWSVASLGASDGLRFVRTLTRNSGQAELSSLWKFSYNSVFCFSSEISKANGSKPCGVSESLEET